MPLKTRRIQRSCDKCRQSKVRCDGPGPGGGCTHCLSFGEQCTYEQPAKSRGPKSKLVEELRRENEELKTQLQSLLCPHCSRPLQLSQPYDAYPAPSPPSVYPHDSPRSSTAPDRSPKPAVVGSHLLPEDSDEVSGDLAVHFGQISIAGMKGGLFGSASSFALVRRLALVKARYLNRPITLRKERGMYWERPPWEDEFYKQRPRYEYPPRDLISALVALYFANIHPTLPVLHRPSFEQQVAEGLYLSDSKFGATLLAVLGLASRYSDDPRVLIDANTLSSGWRFVVQVQTIQNFFEPTVFDVQFYCLMTLYWLGTSAPHTAWLYLGIGVRFLNFRGERNQSLRRDTPKFEEELWNRAFWAFFALDRLVCTFLGRPALIHMEDHDVDPPLAVDDEYWAMGFVQPLGKPSTMAFFVHFLRLFEILGDVLNQLYAREKVKIQRGWTVERGQETVAELDERLERFLEGIPPQLRWDPERADLLFFTQSAMLYTTFYYIKITIHRRFIYIDSRAALTATALYKCLDAARGALRVVDVWVRRTQRLPMPFMQNPLLVSATVLLLNIFVSKHAGIDVDLDVERDLGQVATAIKVFKICEPRWQAAGRLWEVLNGLQSMDEEPRAPPRPAARVYTRPPQPPPIPIPPPPPQALAPAARGDLNPGQAQRGRSEYQPQQPPYASGTNPRSNSRGGLEPGTSIEQLLAETQVLEANDELMSLWVLAPTDVMNVDQWDPYYGRSGTTIANSNLNVSGRRQAAAGGGGGRGVNPVYNVV